MESADQRLQDAVFEPVLTPERERRTVSANDIERDGGLPAADVIEGIKGFGLSCSDPDEPFFTEEEAHVFVELARLRAVWPRDTYLQVSRVYGQALATVARAEVESFRRTAAHRLADAGRDDAAATLRALRDGMEELLALSDPLLRGVHRRWVEHELAQESVFAAEERGEGVAPGSVHVALLFVDIKNFTAYVDTAGDVAGIGAIEQFDRVVMEEHGPTGQVVKALGDGFMLAYPNGSDAVEAGAAIIRRMPPEFGPGVHASIHEGPAVLRNGDYFGRTVNLAARLLGMSGTGELLATARVADGTGDRFRWEPRVTTHIRGFREPIQINRLVERA